MPAYKDLAPAVREVVDRKARALAKRDGIPIAQAREALAARVTTVTWSPTHGAGH